jgi:hypothetical protein
LVIELETPGTTHYLETKAEINGRKLIKAVWDTFLLLWRQRNEFVYGESVDKHQIAQARGLEMKVSRCYESQDIMTIEDRRRVFQMTEEELMKTDIKHIKQWVRMAERIIRTNKRENKKSQGQRKFMDQYFKWNPPDKKKQTKSGTEKLHRKNDLKPDCHERDCPQGAVSGSTLHVR